MGISSAQVIRDCQNFFNPSALFAPLLEQEKSLRDHEPHSQRKRRSKVKRDIRVKMGHGGTLDPLATGVLILGVGKGTKSLQKFLDCTKTYETIVLFGASTDTYDRVGKIIKKSRYDEITRPIVEKALDGFRGKIKQMPPLYSALKMEGKPLYEYAREGRPIPRAIATREVEVAELDLVEWYEPGTHNHRWPTEEAAPTERSLVKSVWNLARRQAASQEEPTKLTPAQEEQETRALVEWESTKRKADERVDDLVRDSAGSSKRRKLKSEDPMMSGALRDMPPSPPPPGRGSNLVPSPAAPDTPPPWGDKGPPACKIRMTVTSGFYVRSLCHDLGEKLECGAMMAELCRIRQGDFSLGGPNCMDYDDLAKGETVWGPEIERLLSAWINKPPGGETGQAASPPSTSSPEAETGPGPGPGIKHEEPAAPVQVEQEMTSPKPSPANRTVGRRSPEHRTLAATGPVSPNLNRSKDIGAGQDTDRPTPNGLSGKGIDRWSGWGAESG
jgi:tRNA pseudouridine55 synthase